MSIEIKRDEASVTIAISEFEQRKDFMIPKKVDLQGRPLVPEAIRMSSMKDGLIVQQHVSDWFRTRYPKLWKPPDNEGIFRTPCDHDFKMCLPTHTVNIDIMSRHRNGSYGLSERKHRTDIHIIASMTYGDILVHGYFTGETLPASLFCEADNRMMPIEGLLTIFDKATKE